MVNNVRKEVNDFDKFTEMYALIIIISMLKTLLSCAINGFSEVTFYNLVATVLIIVVGIVIHVVAKLIVKIKKKDNF